MQKLTGLTTIQAGERFKKYGANSLPGKKPTSDIALLIRQIKSPLVYILLFAAVISFFLQEISDTIIIGLAVGINTVLGFYQERKAERGLLALRSILSPHAKVIRDGERTEIAVRDIVPGDVVVVSEGDKVPADCVVVEQSNLFVNESMLTGESVAVSKKATTATQNMSAEKIREELQLFMGTTVTAGIATAIVQKTGLTTRMGTIADKLSATHDDETPLQKKLAAFAQFLTILVGFGAAVVFITGMLRGRPFEEMFTTSVAVAVAAIPEGMIVALTVILALGMQRILKRKALVRKLVAAETLGSVTVIATDKTGTLTEGQLRVVDVVLEDTSKAYMTAVLANKLLDPLEIALWDWVQKKGDDPKKIRDRHTPVKQIPFDSAKKMSATVYENAAYIIGAPEVLLQHSTVSAAKQRELEEIITTWGARGLRMVGLGAVPGSRLKKNRSTIKLDDFTDISWVGLIGFSDPVRPNVTNALNKARSAGVKLKIVTGDYRLTAEAVLHSIGFDIANPADQVMDGDELKNVSDEQLGKKVNDVMLFSRVSPDQKHRIVKALQANGEVVALLGDGVNDAPAIKQADIGIVVSEATDVAKETADMVLIDSNFETIVAAIEEGRGIFDNLRKVILYLVSSSFAEILTVFGSLLLGVPLPVTAAQILWINIVTDGFPDLALTVDPKAADLLQRKPLPKNAPIFDTEMKVLSVIISVVTGVISLSIFIVARSITGDLAFAQTVTFATLAIGSTLYVFAVRNLQKPLWQGSILSNVYLVFAVFGAIVLQLIALYVAPVRTLLRTKPLPVQWWGIVIAAALLVIVLIELVKFVFNATYRKKHTVQSV